MVLVPKKERNGDMSYPNTRDCEHGRQRGHCPDCERDDALDEIVRKDAEITRLRGALKLIGYKGGTDLEYHCAWCAKQAGEALKL